MQSIICSGVSGDDGEGGRMSECGIFHFYVGRISLSDMALCKVHKGRNTKNC